jgi:hypothetical protein
LAWWSTVSPYGGFGSTAALVFVLLVAAVKSIYEDVKRHHEDSETNNSIAHVLQPDGTFCALNKATKLRQLRHSMIETASQRQTGRLTTSNLTYKWFFMYPSI